MALSDTSHEISNCGGRSVSSVGTGEVTKKEACPPLNTQRHTGIIMQWSINLVTCVSDCQSSQSSKNYYSELYIFSGQRILHENVLTGLCVVTQVKILRTNNFNQYKSPVRVFVHWGDYSCIVYLRSQQMTNKQVFVNNLCLFSWRVMF